MPRYATLDEITQVRRRPQREITLDEIGGIDAAANMGATWVQEDINAGGVDISNYMHRAAARIQQYQQARSDMGENRLTANEQVAIIDAFRQIAGLQPEGYYMTKEGAAVPQDRFAETRRKRTEDDAWANFKSNLSSTVLQNLAGIRATQAKISDSLGITDNALSEAMHDSEEVTRILQPLGGKSGFAGQAVGNVMNLFLAAGQAPAMFATSTAGSTFLDVAQRRANGQEISPYTEWTAAIANATVEYALESFGQKVAQRAGAKLAGRIGDLRNAVAGNGIRGGVRTAASVLVKHGFEQTGMALEGAAEEGITEVLQNTVRRLSYAADQDIFAGVGEAALQGAVMPLLAAGPMAAIQRGRPGAGPGLNPIAPSPAAGDQTIANNVRSVEAIPEQRVAIGEERIRAAAYYNPTTGQIAEGRIHAEAAAEMGRQGGTIFTKEGEPPVQEGFVTTRGRFVSNQEGEQIARQAKQVPEGYEKTSEERVLGRIAAEHIKIPKLAPTEVREQVTPKQMTVDEVVKYVGITEKQAEAIRPILGEGPFIQVNVPVQDLIPKIQTPEDVSAKKLANAKKRLKAGEVAPPVVAGQMGDELVVADGVHRVLAAAEAGQTTIPVIVPVSYAETKGLLPTLVKQIGVEKALRSEETLPDNLKRSLPAEDDIPGAQENSTVGEADLTDKWIGDRQLAETKADIEARNHRRDLNGVLREGEQVDHVDAAIAVYIDMKENSDSYTAENIQRLTLSQQTLVEQAQSLSPDQQAFAEQIIAENKALGIEAMEAGIIQNFKENYSARIWRTGDFPGRKKARFTITTPRQRQRTLPSLIEGWAEGMELEVPGAIEAQMLAKQQITQVIHDRNLVNLGLKSGIFSSTRTDEHTHRVKHPNFAKWVWTGKVGTEVAPEKAAQVYGKDVFLDPEGNLFKRSSMYADKETARFLNNALGSSALYSIPGVGTITKYNSAIKHMILTAALFHHQAYLRSFMLASRGVNPVKAYQQGREAIENFTPELQELVHEGLTIGKILDFDPAIQRESTVVGEMIDKVPMASGIRQALRRLSRANTNFLFGKFGPYLKTQAALLEYRYQLKKNNQRILDGKITRRKIAKKAAEVMNADFGGMNLQRMGRNPTAQHLIRLLTLAPDWTESNIRTMVRAFKGGHEGKVYRAMWGRVLAKGIGATVLFNILMAASDDEKDFFERYETAWKSGNLRWLDADITPIYRALGGEKGKRKYLSIVGHFKDPVKFIRYPARSAKNKSSVIGRMVLDSLTGTDWKGREFTSVGDLIRNGETVKPVPFGGGPVNPKQFPSFIIKQAEQSTTIQAQSLIQWLRGEMDGFDALTRGAGILTSTTYPPKQKKRPRRTRQRRK